jgi:hypothetical protein
MGRESGRAQVCMGCQGLTVHDNEDVGRDVDADSPYRTKWNSF